MRKTLLIAAATLAAGVISSEAQVYSQNIVGYVNIPAAKGYVNVANPLDCGNSLTNVIVNSSGQWNYTLVNIWTGTKYQTYTLDNAMSTGVSDVFDNNPVTAPTILPGQAFFFNNNSGASNNITVVGTVHVDGAGSGVVGVTTNTLGIAPNLTFVGSVLPVGGGLGSALQFPTNGILNYALVQVPVINALGNITGFTTYTVDNAMSTGFSDSFDNNPVPEPIIPVGSGFFFNNNTGSKALWVQAL